MDDVEMHGISIDSYRGEYWQVTVSPRLELASWLIRSFPDQEDDGWVIYYTGSNIQIIRIFDEKIMTMVHLLWS